MSKQLKYLLDKFSLYVDSYEDIYFRKLCEAIDNASELYQIPQNTFELLMTYVSDAKEKDPSKGDGCDRFLTKYTQHWLKFQNVLKEHQDSIEAPEEEGYFAQLNLWFSNDKNGKAVATCLVEKNRFQWLFLAPNKIELFRTHEFLDNYILAIEKVSKERGYDLFFPITFYVLALITALAFCAILSSTFIPNKFYEASFSRASDCVLLAALYILLGMLQTSIAWYARFNFGVLDGYSCDIYCFDQRYYKEISDTTYSDIRDLLAWHVLFLVVSGLYGVYSLVTSMPKLIHRIQFIELHKKNIDALSAPITEKDVKFAEDKELPCELIKKLSEKSKAAESSKGLLAWCCFYDGDKKTQELTQPLLYSPLG